MEPNNTQSSTSPMESSNMQTSAPQMDASPQPTSSPMESSSSPMEPSPSQPTAADNALPMWVKIVAILVVLSLVTGVVWSLL